jgi:hypothetical protein
MQLVYDSKAEQGVPEVGLVLLVPKEPPPLAGAGLLPLVDDVPKSPFAGADCFAFTLAVPKMPFVGAACFAFTLIVPRRLFPLEAAFFAF